MDKSLPFPSFPFPSLTERTTTVYYLVLTILFKQTDPRESLVYHKSDIYQSICKRGQTAGALLPLGLRLNPFSNTHRHLSQFDCHASSVTFCCSVLLRTAEKVNFVAFFFFSQEMKFPCKTSNWTIYNHSKSLLNLGSWNGLRWKDL